MNIEYYIIDPAGNTTALVTTPFERNSYKSVAARITEKHTSVEQVGFVGFDSENIKLNMSGGEFCGNATLSAAALYAGLNGGREYTVPVITYPLDKPITVKVLKTEGGFECEGILNKPYAIKDYSFCADGRDYTFPLVCFDGIMHIVADNTLSETAARGIIKPAASELGASALGIMLYNSKESFLAPLVYVPAVDSLFLENSCASGSCALASVLPEFQNEISIKEPGGSLAVRLTGEGILLKSGIKIIEKCLNEV